MLIRLFAWTIVLTVLGCRARSESPDEGPLPVPECDAYQRAFAACRGQPSAEVPRTTAPTVAERDRLRALCNVNQQRLAQACR